MIRMLLIGYGLEIRSEQRLCEEVHLNRAYRWFGRLGPEGKVPDHFNSDRELCATFRRAITIRIFDVPRAALSRILYHNRSIVSATVRISCD